MSTAAVEPAERWASLRALRSRDFRLIAIGNMVSTIGTWVQYVALGWVARQLTASPFLISLVFAAQWLPFLLLSPITGVIADRFDRRRIVMWGNVLMVLPALLLGELSRTAHMTMAWLVVLVVAGGAAQSFTQPAATAFVPALVGKGDLHSAIALNAGLTNSTRVFGPAIGGLIISGWGVEWAFYANAVSFLAVAIACQLVRVRPPIASTTRNGPIEEIRLGFRYIRDRPSMMRIFVFITVITFFLMQAGLMAVMAKDVLHGDAGTYGAISSGPGTGFVLATIVVANIHDNRRRANVLFLAGLGTAMALLTIGFSRSVPLTVAAMALFGASHMMMGTVASTILLAGSEDAYRGRVMGVYGMVATGLFAINSLAGGAIATVAGAPATIVGCGFAVLLTVTVFLLRGSRGLVIASLEQSRANPYGTH